MTNYDPNNIFAKIIRKEIPCAEVYRDDKVVAFNDIHPAAATHILVLPIGPYQSMDDFVVQASAEDVAYFFKKIRDIAHELGLHTSGYRIIANHGKNASQTVPHFHVHLLGGEPLGGLLAKDKLER